MRKLFLILCAATLAAPLPALAAYAECRAPSSDGLSTLIYSHGARACQAGKVMVCKDGTWERAEGENCR